MKKGAKTKKKVKSTKGKKTKKPATKKKISRKPKKANKAVRKTVKKVGEKSKTTRKKVKKVTKKLAKKTSQRPEKKIRIKSVSKPRERQPANPKPMTPVAVTIPQPETIPPEPVGKVTHYYNHLGVAVILLDKGGLQVGDRIQIKGQTTDFEQTVGSMEIDFQSVQWAQTGQTFGLKVVDHAREHDTIYRLPSGT
ncbi:MAG TPA: hypothetical protein VGB26_06535 [Nitrospiria bacterium]